MLDSQIVLQTDDIHSVKSKSQSNYFRKMAGLELCLRNKFGYCKYYNACHFKHINKECEKVNCDIKSCEERHPKDCWWFKEYKRCKFSYCAYKHVKETNPSTDIKEKIEEIDKLITEKKAEMDLQEQRIREIENKLKDKECDLEKKEEKIEMRVKHLEKFVLTLQEKFEKADSEDLDWGTYNPQKCGWDIFDPLVRRKSMELKCDQCEYVARNSARLQSHIEVLHTNLCIECQKIFETRDELQIHRSLIHENFDEGLTEEEFDNLSIDEINSLRHGPDTPKREDIRKKYNLRLKQKKS